MTCSLDLYTDYLVSSMWQASSSSLSRLLGGTVSYDQVTRWLSTSYLDSEQAWAQAKPVIRWAEAQRPAGEFAGLIVDYSILEKVHIDPSAEICTHWDHNQGGFVKGLNFVSLLYQAGALALPIVLKLIENTKAVRDVITQQYKAKIKYTKNELLLAESWYASAEKLDAVPDLNHHFVMVLESSCTVALSEAEWARGQFQAVDTPLFPDEQLLRVWLRSVKPAVPVIWQVLINKNGSQSVLYGRQRYEPESSPLEDELPKKLESRKIPQVA